MTVMHVFKEKMDFSSALSKCEDLEMTLLDISKASLQTSIDFVQSQSFKGSFFTANQSLRLLGQSNNFMFLEKVDHNSQGDVACFSGLVSKSVQ